MPTPDTLYKIFTDPIHGFISVPKGLILKLIDHPHVQRLRRIRQLGLAYLVFPGGEHSRFSHALGALGLMQRVLTSLREKNTTINNNEVEAMMAAILLHDIGHGPFSHTLESTFIRDFQHEMMTLALMKDLNREFGGALDTAIDIFTNNHPKKFLHQLISSQLDIDRLDYLKRDSVYTGVLEGSIGVDRIIKTMRVHQGNIVIEKKGIYAIENYITSRRLMYMQVYQHKTVLGADKLMRSIFRRVRHMADTKAIKLIFPSPALEYFIRKKPSAKRGITPDMLRQYTLLDDNDVLLSIKYWQFNEDPILADLCTRFLSRKFLRTTFTRQDTDAATREKLTGLTAAALRKNGLPHDADAVSYYLFFDQSRNEAYKYENESIWILDDPKTAVEFSKATETKNILALAQTVVKPFVVHMKDVAI
ncbi:MAG: HD domain-containing protein [Cyclonatronaceae bacterium]